MKRSKFFVLLFGATLLFFFISCGNKENKSSETTVDTTAATPPATTTQQEMNTIITTPQNIMSVKHKVADFEKWKMSYDEHDSMRLANGMHSFVIGRGVQDPNMVHVVVKVDDMEKAKAFAKDPSLKKAMQKGGVIGTPAFSFVTMVYQDSGPISTDLRSRTTFTVKDWDGWQKAFEGSMQERLDNGISIRAYGHDVDNNKKVTVIAALVDSTKALAYWKTDALKKKMAEAGMVGTPDRFLYRVVEMKR